MLSPSLEYIKRFNQFICYRLVPSASRSGKTDKLPVHPVTGGLVSAHDPANWMSYENAVDACHGELRVGFVLTPETKLFVLDIDGALMPDNTWHPLVGKIRAALPRAGVEVSTSNTGLHNWGRYEGPEPAHTCTTTVDGIKIELYTSRRFIALGDQRTAMGDAGADCTTELRQVIADYFSASEASSKDTGEWSEGHELGWELPDDDELVRRALSFRGAGVAFGGKASFADLWTRNVAVLSKAYPSNDGRDFDESQADFALAGKLAWVTGNDCPRIARLMWKSGLVRDKWETHKTYLCDFTIRRALVKDGNFYDPKFREHEDDVAPGGTYIAAGTIADMTAVAAQNPNKDEAVSLMMQLGTQDSIAGAFATLYSGKLKFDHARKRWHVWDGRLWRGDDKKTVFNLVVNLCREKNREGKSSMGTASFARGVEDIAASRPNLTISGREWDRNNYLLNTPAGTYDLSTGKLRLHDPADLITKCTVASPSPDSDGASFRKFMTEVTGGDEELIQFHQISLGACLSGALEDHWMLFWTGVGRNGKNTLGELVQDIMGDYAKKIESSTLMSKKFKSHSEEIANLHGVRLAISSELNDGEHWDEARINEVTGDASLSARHLYGDRFEFKRTQKHLIYANYKPQLRSVSDGIRSRIKIVPFKESFLGREDKDLPKRLRGDLDYVLQWMIEGHAKWLAAGKRLPKCGAVESETAEYFAKQSTPQLWLKECCEVLRVDTRLQKDLPSVGELYRSYKDWAIARGEQPVGLARWQEPALRGFEPLHTKRGVQVRGLRLKLPFELPPISDFEEALEMAATLSVN